MSTPLSIIQEAERELEHKLLNDLQEAIENVVSEYTKTTGIFVDNVTFNFIPSRKNGDRWNNLGSIRIERDRL